MMLVERSERLPCLLLMLAGWLNLGLAEEPIGAEDRGVRLLPEGRLTERRRLY